ERLRDVPLGDVRLDQRSLRTLTQRVGGNRHRPRLDGLDVTTLVDPVMADRLQAARPELAEALALGHDPILVPARQELARQQGDALLVGPQLVPDRPAYKIDGLVEIA